VGETDSKFIAYKDLSWEEIKTKLDEVEAQLYEEDEFLSVNGLIVRKNYVVCVYASLEEY
jgi:hypothetical protein